MTGVEGALTIINTSEMLRFYAIITLTKRRQLVVKQLNTVRDDVKILQKLLLQHAKGNTKIINVHE